MSRNDEFYAHVNMLRDTFQALDELAVGGVFINFSNEQLCRRVRELTWDGLNQLASLKRMWESEEFQTREESGHVA